MDDPLTSPTLGPVSAVYRDDADTKTGDEWGRDRKGITMDSTVYLHWSERVFICTGDSLFYCIKIGYLPLSPTLDRSLLSNNDICTVLKV